MTPIDESYNRRNPLPHPRVYEVVGNFQKGERCGKIKFCYHFVARILINYDKKQQWITNQKELQG